MTPGRSTAVLAALCSLVFVAFASLASAQTEEDMQAALKKAIDDASKVSKELGEYLNDGNVKLDNVDDTVSAPIKEGALNNTDGTKFPKEQTQTRVSRSQIKDALKDADTAEKKAAYNALLVGQLLHEAEHRKALADGTWTYQSREEDRNTQALINRLIGSIDKLKCKLPGQPDAEKADLGDGTGLAGDDPAQSIKLLRKIIEQQVQYRAEKMLDKEHGSPAWQNRMKNLAVASDQLQKDLKAIPAGLAPAAKAQKEAAARKKFEKNEHGQKLKEELEKEFGIKLDPEQPLYDQVKMGKSKWTGQFRGKDIPDCPKEESPKPEPPKADKGDGSNKGGGSGNSPDCSAPKRSGGGGIAGAIERTISGSCL